MAGREVVDARDEGEDERDGRRARADPQAARAVQGRSFFAVSEATARNRKKAVAVA
jgi:hypothetical protein